MLLSALFGVGVRAWGRIWGHRVALCRLGQGIRFCSYAAALAWGRIWTTGWLEAAWSSQGGFAPVLVLSYPATGARCCRVEGV